jgi:hypothetical protein
MPFLDPNLLEKLPRLPPDEIQRLQQLQNLLSAGKPMLSTPAPIPSLLDKNLKPPCHLLNRDRKRFDHDLSASGSYRDRKNSRNRQEGLDPPAKDKDSYNLHLRVPPPVPGGRGFFQDLKDPKNPNETKRTNDKVSD